MYPWFVLSILGMCFMVPLHFLSVEHLKFQKKYGVDKIPATVLVGDKDYGIHFYGVPGGYEFNVLIEDILNIGKRDAELSNDVLAELNKVDQPVHLQVLISPT